MSAIIIYQSKETGRVDGVGLCDNADELQKKVADFNNNPDNPRRVTIRKVDDLVEEAFTYVLGGKKYKRLKDVNDLCDYIDNLTNTISDWVNSADELCGEANRFEFQILKIKEQVADLKLDF